MKRAIADLELSLVHLQQDIDIPEIHLSINSVVKQVVAQAREQQRKAEVQDFGDKYVCMHFSLLSLLLFFKGVSFSSLCVSGLMTLSSSTSFNVVLLVGSEKCKKSQSWIAILPLALLCKKLASG